MSPEQRAERLRNDLAAIKHLEGPVVSIRKLVGSPPERYELAIRLRTIIGPKPDYRTSHRVAITLDPGYPKSPPLAVMLDPPPPFHPNWFTDGRWCPGDWSYREGLGEFVVRMLRTIRFAYAITNSKSPANGAAKTWYQQHRNRGLFPTDDVALPNPRGSARRFDIVQPAAVPSRRGFSIHGVRVGDRR